MTQEEIASIVAGLRATFQAGVTKPLTWRIRQLRCLRSMLIDHGSAFERALSDDLHKNPTESQLVEIGFVIGEIDHVLKNLRSWLRPKRVGVPASVMPARASILHEPLGVVLVIAPWNYPLQLLLTPVVGALAAGNAVVMKPSELAPATSSAINRFIPQYLDTNAVAVLEGGAAETTDLLGEKFDHIFYTGNARVGEIVMTAAAKHLTPVTLELGGKSPVFIDDTVDLVSAAKRIAWGKFMNAGQTCVAPDYILATPDVAFRLETHLAEAVHELYGAEPELSPDFGRIINDTQFTRLGALIDDGRTVFGGTTDPGTRYIAPTVLADVSTDSAVMKEEVFGPILPIVTVDNVDQAIAQINTGEKPLSLYVFSESVTVRRRFLTETSSGAVGFGIPAAHLAVPGLPFGGVGASGMGAYHGVHSVARFSHEKAILSKRLKPDTMQLVYPPYTEKKDRFIRRFLRKLG